MKKGKKTVTETISLFLVELRGKYGEQEIRAILYRLFSHSLGWSRADIQLNRNTFLDVETDLFFVDALRRLKQDEPVQYIIGSTDFCGLLIAVNPCALIPRPETEEMAELVISENRDLMVCKTNVLDLGTGSGCLALAMKRAFPHSRVTGVDLFPPVLDLARRNALENGLEVTFLEGDMLHPGKLHLEGFFDIILSNPPYIPVHERELMSRHVAESEPPAALFVPSDRPLLFNEAIASIAVDRLDRNGRLYLEIHEKMGSATARLLGEAGLTSVKIIKDRSGKNRFIRASAPLQKS